jgi:D-psicose/D-tagatose/L-ribulose 3-epimerase
MKFGTHCYLFVDRWSDDSLFVLDASKELGLDCVEIAVGDDVQFTPAVTAHQAETLGLDLIVSPGGFWPDSADLSSTDQGERKGALDWHKKQVDLANTLGAIAYCGALYGHPGLVKKRQPDPDEYPRTADGLHRLADYATGSNVMIVLEPMSHFRTHVVNTPSQAMRLIELADHSNLRVLLDTYHLVTEITDYADAIQTCGDRLWGVHACENNRGVPGSGLIPWHDVFAALGDGGFDGYVLLETYNSSLPYFANGRGMFHNVCPDGGQFIQEGLGFLKKGFARHGRA